MANFINSKINNQVMMKKLSFIIFTLTVLSLVSFDLNAQIRTPAASPTATFSQEVGLTKVEIVYSRPSVKERTIFAADGLVPFGKMWRTGANQATKISFSDDVKVGGKDLKKGTYAILTIPTATEWTVNFYPHESGSWSSYVEKSPAVSLQAKAESMPFSVETFTITLNNQKSNSADLLIYWEKSIVGVSIEAEVDSKVTKNIEAVLGGPSQNDYYQAASYYHDAGKDLKQALEWVKMANAENPKFWQVRREALILADMGQYAAAIKAAEQSKSLAMKAENSDYVSMNEKSIAEWSKKTGDNKAKSLKSKAESKS